MASKSTNRRWASLHADAHHFTKQFGRDQNVRFFSCDINEVAAQHFKYEIEQKDH
ncbi:Uncharacterised protein [Vibrio cholerae]|nr:Uncharacterised protein [Vibrio cholerae]